MPSLSFFILSGFAMLVLLLVILFKITKLLRSLDCDKKIPILPISFFINNIKITGGITMLKLKNDQLARFVVGSPVDKKGDETTIEAGSLKVTSSNEEVITVEKDDKDADNDAAFKAVAGRKGAAVLTISADADLGEGTKTITVEIAVEVESGEAVGFAEPQFVVENQTEAGNGEGGEGNGEETV